MSLLGYIKKKTPTEHQELPYTNELHVSGLFVQNDVVASDDVCITQSITGNIYCAQNIIICKDAEVNGSVNCRNCVLEGKVNGNISAFEMLEIKANAILNGNIMAGKLSVGSSAVLNGCIVSINTRQARQISSDIKVKIDDIKQSNASRREAVPEVQYPPVSQKYPERLNRDPEVSETKATIPMAEPVTAEDNGRWW